MYSFYVVNSWHLLGKNEFKAKLIRKADSKAWKSKSNKPKCKYFKRFYSSRSNLFYFRIFHPSYFSVFTNFNKLVLVIALKYTNFITVADIY